MQMIQFEDARDTSVVNLTEFIYASIPGYASSVRKSNSSNVSDSGGFVYWDSEKYRNADGDDSTTRSVMGILDFGSNYTLVGATSFGLAMDINVTGIGVGVPRVYAQCSGTTTQIYGDVGPLRARFINASFTGSTLGWNTAYSLWNNSYSTDDTSMVKLLQYRFYGKGSLTCYYLDATENVYTPVPTRSAPTQQAFLDTPAENGWRKTAFSNFSVGSGKTITAYGIMFLPDDSGSQSQRRTRERFWPGDGTFPSVTNYLYARYTF